MAEADPPDGQREAEKMNSNLRARVSVISLNSFLAGAPADRAEVRRSTRRNLPTATRNRKRLRGQDIQGDILITLDEVLKGAMRAISVRRTNARSGQEETETYQVRIPKGVQAGQTIRVSGKGGQGLNGGSAGDIYLRVRFAEHPDWQVRGADLIGSLELAPWEAVLGATVPVRTLEGSISVKVPAGFQQGQKLRVRGKGLPAGGAKRGDLYVEASIQVPATHRQRRGTLVAAVVGRIRIQSATLNLREQSRQVADEVKHPMAGRPRRRYFWLMTISDQDGKKRINMKKTYIGFNSGRHGGFAFGLRQS